MQLYLSSLGPGCDLPVLSLEVAIVVHQHIWKFHKRPLQVMHHSRKPFQDLIRWNIMPTL